MVNLDADKDQPYSFGVKNIQHRIFNETPAIHRQLMKITEESSVTNQLLKKREGFTERTAVPSLRKPLITRKAVLMEETGNVETFKPIKAIGEFFDTILSAAAIVAFLVFVAYMCWICFFDDWRGERVAVTQSVVY